MVTCGRLSYTAHMTRALPSSTEAPSKLDRVARKKELDARFADYVRTGSFAAVARLHAVSAQAIRAQADREDWRLRAAEVHRKQRQTREVVASRRHLEQLERIDEVVDTQLDALDEPDPDVDPLHRAGTALMIIERSQKVKATAHEALPPEDPTPELELKLLTDAELECWRFVGDLREALQSTSPGEALRRLRSRTEPVPTVEGGASCSL